MGRIALGVDLGQQRDPSAVAVVELRAERYLSGTPQLPQVEVTHLERIALGTSYVVIASRIEQLARQLHFLDVTTVLDAGGPGRAVIDDLRARGLPRVVAVQATGGTAATRTKLGRNGMSDWNVAKSVLLKNLSSLVYSSRLRIAAGLSEAEQLVRELADLETRVSAAGRETFDVASGAEHHADLVSAVALGCWEVLRPHPRIRYLPPMRSY